MPKKKKPAEMAPKEPQKENTVMHHAFFRFGKECLGIAVYDDYEVNITLYTDDDVINKRIKMKGE
ncbi:MAG: hypothetical protein IKA94_06205 [Mogibacterium sp.]|nr:hypothetical protein [Mogibacterium sp.]